MLHLFWVILMLFESFCHLLRILCFSLLKYDMMLNGVCILFIMCDCCEVSLNRLKTVNVNSYCWHFRTLFIFIINQGYCFWHPWKTFGTMLIATIPYLHPHFHILLQMLLEQNFLHSLGITCDCNKKFAGINVYMWFYLLMMIRFDYLYD